ncbi:MAG: hypothetical protein JXJ04_14930 [Spirochaetales bacterium]|nr:hypothetical protein [Spirochaetales bacterium]
MGVEEYSSAPCVDNISKVYQKERFQRRLSQRDKNRKFNPADLTERKLWNDYIE